MKNTKIDLPVLSAIDGTKAEQAAGVIAGHPDPEVVARAKRRIFTGEYKQRVLAEADRARGESGGIGALLDGGLVLLSPGDVAKRAHTGNPARAVSAIVSRAGKVVPKVSGAHGGRPRSGQRGSVLEHFAPPSKEHDELILFVLFMVV